MSTWAGDRRAGSEVIIRIARESRLHAPVALGGAVFSPGRQTALCQCLSTRRTWQTCTKQKMMRTPHSVSVYLKLILKKGKSCPGRTYLHMREPQAHCLGRIYQAYPLCSRVCSKVKCVNEYSMYMTTLFVVMVFQFHRELDATQGRGNKDRSNQMPELEAKVGVVSVLTG